MELWIARDSDNELRVFTSKPYPKHGIFRTEFNNDDFIFLDYKLFPEVTFKNSPQRVKLRLVDEIIGVSESPSKTFPRLNEFEVGSSYRR